MSIEASDLNFYLIPYAHDIVDVLDVLGRELRDMDEPSSPGRQ